MQHGARKPTFTAPGSAGSSIEHLSQTIDLIFDDAGATTTRSGAAAAAVRPAHADGLAPLGTAVVPPLGGGTAAVGPALAALASALLTPAPLSSRGATLPRRSQAGGRSHATQHATSARMRTSASDRAVGAAAVAGFDATAGGGTWRAAGTRGFREAALRSSSGAPSAGDAAAAAAAGLSVAEARPPLLAARAPGGAGVVAACAVAAATRRCQA